MRAQVSLLLSGVKIFIGLVTIGLSAIGTASAKEPYQAVAVLFGDSITSGFNSNFLDARFGNGTTTRGCPTIYLNNILRKEKARTSQETCPTEALDSPILDQNNKVRNAVVANWGEGGSNTTSGASRISSNLSETKNDLTAENYFVLIMYGSNDAAFGISSSVTGFNIRQMIIKARELDYEPIIGTLTPQSDIDVSPYNTQIVNAANLQPSAFVVDHFARFVSQPGGWPTLLEEETFSGQTRRLHPNDQGYLVISETWFDKRLEDVIPGFFKINIAPIINLLLDDDV
jgi:lysophospholipase L1-like esterase